MMMPFNHSEEIPTYKEYKNRRFQQKKEKMNGLLWEIKSSSLKTQDKNKLKEELLKLITDFNI